MEAPDEILPTDGSKPLPLILCYHPHGCLDWSYIINGGFRQEFEPRLGLVAEMLYYTPLFR